MQSWKTARFVENRLNLPRLNATASTHKNSPTAVMLPGCGKETLLPNSTVPVVAGRNEARKRTHARWTSSVNKVCPFAGVVGGILEFGQKGPVPGGTQVGMVCSAPLPLLPCSTQYGLSVSKTTSLSAPQIFANSASSSNQSNSTACSKSLCNWSSESLCDSSRTSGSVCARLIFAGIATA